MIIMINGSFGVGKTSVATLLEQSLPDTMLYDPEIVGSALRKLTEQVRLPDERTDDFRDIALWPHMVVDMASALRRQYRKNMVVPMTIDNRVQLDFIRSGFGRIDKDVHHFCLTAPLDIVLERIQSRPEGNGEWEINKARQCSVNFTGDEFNDYIDANKYSPRQIVDFIKNNIKTIQPYPFMVL